MKFRYYQGRIDITKHCNRFALGKPFPVRFTERVLFTPDIGQHYCSSMKMTDCFHLDALVEFESGIEVSEDHREAWDMALLESEWESVTPIPWSAVVADYDKEGPIVLRGKGNPIVEHAYQGEYEDLEDDDSAFEQAREDAQGNHFV